jgi:predicted RNA methylase
MMNNTGLKRDNLDKYYTKPQVVCECMQMIKNHISINYECDLIIEPSAGNGSFVDEITKTCKTVKFYDIEPEHPDVIKQDYLTLCFDHQTYDKIHVIGNPPFGRQSALAIKFIKKSTSFCNTISFILPKSFKKDSLQKHFPLNYHLVLQYDIPNDSFIVNGKEHDVPCIFQIWEKQQVARMPPERLQPHGYTFVKKEQPHDISFRRVGVYAGTIDTHTDDKSIQSHYFIKFTISDFNSILGQIKNIVFGCKDNTVGPRSISKQELMKEFNTIILKHIEQQV